MENLIRGSLIFKGNRPSPRLRLEYSRKMALQTIIEFNSYSFILHFLVFVLPHVYHCICLSCLYYDFHAFSKVATLPDTDLVASEARDTEIHQGYKRGGGSFSLCVSDPRGGHQQKKKHFLSGIA